MRRLTRKRIIARTYILNAVPRCIVCLQRVLHCVFARALLKAVAINFGTGYICGRIYGDVKTRYPIFTKLGYAIADCTRELPCT